MFCQCLFLPAPVSSPSLTVSQAPPHHQLIVNHLTLNSCNQDSSDYRSCAGNYTSVMVCVSDPVLLGELSWWDSVVRARSWSADVRGGPAPSTDQTKSFLLTPQLSASTLIISSSASVVDISGSWTFFHLLIQWITLQIKCNFSAIIQHRVILDMQSPGSGWKYYLNMICIQWL